MRLWELCVLGSFIDVVWCHCMDLLYILIYMLYFNVLCYIILYCVILYYSMYTISRDFKALLIKY